jgi:hypothetical protein
VKNIHRHPRVLLNVPQQQQLININILQIMNNNHIEQKEVPMHRVVTEVIQEYQQMDQNMIVGEFISMDDHQEEFHHSSISMEMDEMVITMMV